MTDHKYGVIEEGRMGYLNPANYARAIYRRRFKGESVLTSGRIRRSGEKTIVDETPPMSILEALPKAAQAKANGDLETFYRITTELNEQQRPERPGLIVVPLHDCFGMIDACYGPLIAMNCVCRKEARGEDSDHLPGPGLDVKTEHTCLGLGAAMFKNQRWPEVYRGGVDYLTPSQAKEFIEYLDRRGYLHMLMMEGIYTSAIGGICNCDYPTCWLMRWRLDYGIKGSVRKADYIAKVDYSRCNGCGDCVKRCQFGALRYEVALDRANIDPFQCFGCGLCSNACPRSAIDLLPKEKFPVLANEL